MLGRFLDRTSQFRVPSGARGEVLGVADLKWACDP